MQVCRRATHVDIDVSFSQARLPAQQLGEAHPITGQDDLPRLLQRVVQLGADVERCEDRFVVRGKVLEREEEVKAVVEELSGRYGPPRAATESQNKGNIARQPTILVTRGRGRAYKPSRAPTHSANAQAASLVASACLIDCLPLWTDERWSTSVGVK